MVLQVAMVINFLKINFLLGSFRPHLRTPSHPRPPPPTKSVIMFRVKWSKGIARPHPLRQQLPAAFRQPGHNNREALAYHLVPACYTGNTTPALLHQLNTLMQDWAQTGVGAMRWGQTDRYRLPVLLSLKDSCRTGKEYKEKRKKYISKCKHRNTNF